jgi:hypothetical protein
VLVTAAVSSEISETPMTISIEPTSFPVVVVGTTSPYPTVVTVCSAHQVANPTDGKLCGSAARITIPPTSASTKNVTANPNVTERALAIRADRRSTRPRLTSGGCCFAPINPRVLLPQPVSWPPSGGWVVSLVVLIFFAGLTINSLVSDQRRPGSRA